MNMKSRFKHKESYKHKMAKTVLAEWTDGIMEEPFCVDGQYLFVPDVMVRENGVIKTIYEVVNTHSFTGKKLGIIQEWCYRNATELSVFEISADYILTQTEKPDQIRCMEYYNVEF